MGKATTLSEAERQPARWTDTLWIAIFLSVTIGFVVIAAVDLSDYVKTSCFRLTIGDPRVILFDPHVLAIMAACILTAMALSALYYSLAAVFTQYVVWITILLQLAVSLGSSVFYLVEQKWLEGTLCLMWMLLSIFVYWLLKDNVKHATSILVAVMDVASHHPMTIIVGAVAALLTAAWSVLVGSVILAGLGKLETGKCAANGRRRPEPEFLGLLVYLAVANYTMGEVIKAIVRISLCNVYGWWFYEVKNRPRYLCMDGLKKAFSCSLGSLCFASFWIAVVSVATQILGALSQLLMTNGTEVSIVLTAWLINRFVCVFDCILSHFTNYILVHICLYNHSYIQGAQSSARILKAEGRRAVANDFLAGGTLTFGSWCIGTCSALVCYLYLRCLGDYPMEGVYFLTAYTTVIGMQIGSVFTTCIASGVQTLFVAMAVDPHRLQETHPEAFETLMETRR